MKLNPSIVVMAAGAECISMIVIDVASEDRAIALAKLLADQTGRTVTVSDESGDLLETVCGPRKC